MKSSLLTQSIVLLGIIPGSIMAHANTDIVAMLFNQMSGAHLGASKPSATLMTSYSNATFNMSYTAPTGWSFNTPTVGASGLTITATSPSYLATVTIGAFSRTDAEAARCLGPGWCFQMSSACFAQNDSQVTYGYYVSDTTYSNTNNHFSWQQIIYLDDHSMIECDYCVQNGDYIQIVSYSTSVADFILNDSIYFQHVANLTWYSTTLAKQSVTAKVSSQSDRTANIYDFLGRSHPRFSDHSSSAIKASFEPSASQILVNGRSTKITVK